MTAKEYYDESYVSKLLEADKTNQTSSTDSNPSTNNNNYLDTAVEAAERFNKEFDGLFDG